MMALPWRMFVSTDELLAAHDIFLSIDGLSPGAFQSKISLRWKQSRQCTPIVFHQSSQQCYHPRLPRGSNKSSFSYCSFKNDLDSHLHSLKLSHFLSKILLHFFLQPRSRPVQSNLRCIHLNPENLPNLFQTLFILIEQSYDLGIVGV